MRNFDEKDLVCKLDKILKKEFGTNLAFREFSAGYGIADLVFAPNFSFNNKLLARSPMTSFNGLRMLVTLEEGKTYDIKDVVNIFPYLTLNEINKQLRILVSNGYFAKISKNLYLKLDHNKYSNPINKIIAIEVKLRDHKNGLIQARRYQYFADESYLAILKQSEKNINYEEFNRFNIGLILFDEKTNTIEIKHPVQSNPNYEGMVSLFAKEMMLNKFVNFAY